VKFLDHAWIASRIPHKGSMCLLDRVTDWNETRIVCKANSHRSPDNPLRQEGRLGITTGVEYAAQAMAVHGVLLADNDKSHATGYLTSVRNVHWNRNRLDELDGEIEVHAERLSGNEISILYSFRVFFGEEVLIEGKASIMLNATGSSKKEKTS
jgi:Predicted 3-hydroxylacyl-(acyl carrier protein) dehydratase